MLRFDSAEPVREAILAQVAPGNFEATTPNRYGDRYQSVILITGPSGKARYVKTIWTVLTGESVARFVTAVPKILSGG
ncbi:MAG: DUF6883 domain-containing protein [Phormidesmis sp.]